MEREEPRDLTWLASSHSGGNGNCVEVADGVRGVVPVRDSKSPETVIVVSAAAWRTFTAHLTH
ncbi:DUF397 domain-containing protein [Streptomyces avicenniae]|uniref:DUF397 domain-containing protein n=1 Tax=Streptomyces avicenniae TaxID=500153 RepID=UPI0006997751|nr:DUF397 domain-containing protein [Streptomyces avicenniae]